MEESTRGRGKDKHVPVVWPVLEPQRRAMREEVPELRGVAAAELLRVRGLLALQDPLVLLFFGVGLQPCMKHGKVTDESKHPKTSRRGRHLPRTLPG